MVWVLCTTTTVVDVHKKGGTVVAARGYLVGRLPLGRGWC